MKRQNYTYIILIFIFIVLFAIIITVYYNYSPTDNYWFPPCLFKKCTGLCCPGCGIQRAVHSILNGNWAEALSYNYFFVISIPYAINLSVAFVLQKNHRCSRLSELLAHRFFARIYVCCFFFWFIIRNIIGI